LAPLFPFALELSHYAAPSHVKVCGALKSAALVKQGQCVIDLRQCVGELRSTFPSHPTPQPDKAVKLAPGTAVLQ